MYLIDTTQRAMHAIIDQFHPVRLLEIPVFLPFLQNGDLSLSAVTAFFFLFFSPQIFL